MNDEAHEIDILADYLANFHDWETGDSLLDFISYAKDNDLSISESVLRNIFHKFQELDALKKYDRKFDHKDFIRRYLRD